MGRPKKNYPASSTYKRHLRQRYKTPFPCSFCKEMILAEKYENHITNRKHPLDVKLKCPWCQKFSWASGKKHKNMDHLKNCVELFFNRQNTIFGFDDESCQTIPYFDLTPEFPTKDFFDEEHLTINHHYWKIDEEYSDTDYNVPDKYILKFESSELAILKEWNSITFQSDVLNQAADIIKYYLLTTRDNDSGLERKYWYHGMIRTVAINSFYEHFDHNDKNNGTRILPYYCHCTGGLVRDEFDQHIHLLIVTNADNPFRDNRFMEDVWTKIMAHRKPGRNYKCKYIKKIVSPRHLLNSIGYVSGRKSRCQFGRSVSKEHRLNHFNLNCSFPKNFKYALSTLWETGIYDLIENKYQHYKPLFNIDYRNDDRGVVHEDGQWKIKCEFLPGLMSKIRMLPVDLHYREVPYKTNTYLHFGKQNTMYLEKSENCIFLGKKFQRRMKPERLTFRPNFQETFNIVKRSVDQVLDMKNTLHMEMKETNQNQQKTIENLQNANQNQQKTIENLQNTIQAKDAQLEDLNKNRHKDLREWNVNLQKTIENQQAEIRELKNTIQAKDAQIEYLNKNRNIDLQKTIENLQAEVRELKTTLQAKEMEMEKMKRNPVYYVSITP